MEKHGRNQSRCSRLTSLMLSHIAVNSRRSYRTIWLQFLQHYWSGHRLALLWYWMAWLENRVHSVIFEITPKYCVSDSCWPRGLLHSSKRFLPIVWWSSELNPPILVHVSSVILKCQCSLLPFIVWPLLIYLIHGYNIPGSYAILFFGALDFTFTTRHIHNGVSFLLWPSHFIFFWSY